MYWAPAAASNAVVDKDRRHCHCELTSVTACHQTGGHTLGLGQHRVTIADQRDPADGSTLPTAAATTMEPDTVRYSDDDDDNCYCYYLLLLKLLRGVLYT